MIMLFPFVVHASAHVVSCELAEHVEWLAWGDVHDALTYVRAKTNEIVDRWVVVSLDVALRNYPPDSMFIAPKITRVVCLCRLKKLFRRGMSLGELSHFYEPCEKPMASNPPVSSGTAFSCSETSSTWSSTFPYCFREVQCELSTLSEGGERGAGTVRAVRPAVQLCCENTKVACLSSFTSSLIYTEYIMFQVHLSDERRTRRLRSQEPQRGSANAVSNS